MKPIVMLYVILFSNLYARTQENNLKINSDTAHLNKTPISPWKTHGRLSLLTNQMALYQWQSGGENNISISGQYRGDFEYTKNNITSTSYIDIAYGLVQQGEQSTSKSDDRWEISSQIGNKISEKININGFFNLRSQFSLGLDPDDLSLITSNLMAPGYLSIGFGANINLIDGLDVNLSPFTGKFTFILDDSIANQIVVDPLGVAAETRKYGNKPGSNSTSEFGFHTKISFDKEIMENITLTTQASFFSDYLHDFGVIDVNWDLIMILKVNEFISVNISTNLIYDQDIAIVLERNSLGEPTKIGPSVQFKEIIGVGLTYIY